MSKYVLYVILDVDHVHTQTSIYQYVVVLMLYIVPSMYVCEFTPLDNGVSGHTCERLMQYVHYCERLRVRLDNK